MSPKQGQTDKAGTPANEPDRSMDRRAALARLGLAAGVAYLAPTLSLIRSAAAQGNSGNQGNQGNGPSPWVGKSKPSKPSK